MGKILEKDFRNGLYKSLVEAGYNKDEAQKIIGQKYYGALKEDVVKHLNEAIENVNNDNVAFQVDAVINESLAELTKLKEILA